MNGFNRAIYGLLNKEEIRLVEIIKKKTEIK